MDPNACWAEITTLLNDRDLDVDGEITLVDRCHDLSGWLDKGGFIPTYIEESGLRRESLLRVLESLTTYYA